MHPSPPPVPATEKRPRAEQARPVSQSERQPHRAETSDNIWQAFWRQLNGAEGAAFSVSLFLHMLLLALMALVVLPTLRPRESFTTVVQRQDGEDVPAFDNVDTEAALDLPESPPEGEKLKTELFESIDTDSLVPEVDPSQFPKMAGEKSSQAVNKASDSGGGGRIAAPENAIRAGNFTVWSWPIIGKNLQGDLLHTKPGSPPQVFQDYHIVIRLRVPDDRRTVRLSDFRGEVVGTDKYYQKIPQDAWFFSQRGELVRARTGRSIPVIEGTAELLIRVPGAGTPEIRDKITVYSRLLDEEQTMELVFQERP